MSAASSAASRSIVVNGEPRAVAAGSTALDLLVELGLDRRPVAVEINEQVVPRADLGGCMLSSGDRLEIVTLVGGG
jgi:sulfur carrier protein